MQLISIFYLNLTADTLQIKKWVSLQKAGKMEKPASIEYFDFHYFFFKRHRSSETKVKGNGKKTELLFEISIFNITVVIHSVKG